MSNFVYNDTHSRNHVPPVPLPLPRQFTVVYMDGWGCRVPTANAMDMEHVKPGDVVVMNIWAHCQRVYTFSAWRVHMDGVAKLLAGFLEMGVPVVWRTTFMIEEDVFRSHPEHVDGCVKSLQHVSPLTTIPLCYRYR